MHSNFEVITPERALDLLTANTNNRKLRPSVVARYAGAMARGEWRPNGEAIKIAEDGTLLDGQHRLEACVEAEVPFETLIVTGLSKNSQQTMDGGLKRGTNDHLAFMGEKNTTVLASALRLIVEYEMYGTIGIRGGDAKLVTDPMLMAALDRHPHMRETVSSTGLLRKMGAITPSQTAALMYIMRSGPYQTQATLFFDQLKNGYMLTPDSPLLNLRNQVLGQTQSRLGAARTAALTVKAWNSYVLERPMRQLRWAPSEAFPEIEGSRVPVLGPEIVFGLSVEAE